VGHSWGVEGEAGIAEAVEENEAAGGVSAFGEKMDGFARGHIGGGKRRRKRPPVSPRKWRAGEGDRRPFWPRRLS